MSMIAKTLAPLSGVKPFAIMKFGSRLGRLHAELREGGRAQS